MAKVAKKAKAAKQAKTSKTARPAKTSKAAKTSKTAKRANNAKADQTYRAKIRMYRHGLGDCFLLTFPGTPGKPKHMVIDCGVILGTKKPADLMTAVVDDLQDATNGRIDVLAVTHEHWDHVSGFAQVEDWKDRFDVGEVWFGWTEDPKDALAVKLDKYKDNAMARLTRAAARMRLSGMGAAAQVESILGFYGIGSENLGASGTTLGATSVRNARDEARKLGPVRYHKPGDAPLSVGSAKGPRVFVLGPPHDEKAIKRYNPSKKEPETYELAATDSAASLDRVLRMDADTETSDMDAPFAANYAIPLDYARGMDFFRKRYWGDADFDDLCSEYCYTRNNTEERDANLALLDQSWRRVDDAWMAVSPELALKLDSATNNTSLVLAIELEPGGDVLLFAGDAQVGNWLSWSDVTWTDGGQTVTGTDLIKRTLLYKVGHHGSHNATLKEKGLELMSHPGLMALVPVDHEMCIQKKWDEIPRESLMKRLHDKAQGRVLRTDDPAEPTPGKPPKGVDREVWNAFVARVTTAATQVPRTEGGTRPLWYEVAV